MLTENGLEYEVVEYTLQNVINNLSTIFKGWTKEDRLRASKQQNQYAMVFVGKDGKPFLEDEHIYDAWRDFSNRLGICIIDDFESDRMENGRKELVKGLGYLFSKFKEPHDRDVISETLITMTGFSLSIRKGDGFTLSLFSIKKKRRLDFSTPSLLYLNP